MRLKLYVNFTWKKCYRQLGLLGLWIRDEGPAFSHRSFNHHGFVFWLNIISVSEKSWHGNNRNPPLFLRSGWPPCQPRNLFLSKPRVCIVGSPLNSHPSWLVTRLSAAPPLPSGGTITPDLEALYLNHITRPCVFYFPFEVTGVRHLSGPVWVHVPLSHHILISWSDFLSVCVFVRERVCVWSAVCIFAYGWLRGFVCELRVIDRMMGR